MKKKIQDKILALRKSILLIFFLFSFLEIIQISILDRFTIVATLPIIIYFLVSFFIISPIFLFNQNYIGNNLMEYVIFTISFMIYSAYNFLLTSVFISIEKIWDIHFFLSIIMLFFFVTGLVLGNIFTNKNDLILIEKDILLRGNEIEIKKFNPWARLNLDKAPWLRKPLKSFGHILVFFIIFIGGSAAGLSLAIVEIFRRTEILGQEIDIYAFLFFILGTPVGIAAGVVLAPLFCYLTRWRKLVKKVRETYGSYTVIYN